MVPGFEAYNTRLDQNLVLSCLTHLGIVEDLILTLVGEFSSHKVDGFQPKNGAFVMMTIRSHDQFNTTIYSNNDRYRGINGSRNVVLMSSVDMNRMGLGLVSR